MKLHIQKMVDKNFETLHFRCIAIVLPLKRMDWMTVQAAKRKIIPLVIFACLAYTSYRVLTVVKADPGILACNTISGTSLVVSSKLHINTNLKRMLRKKPTNDSKSMICAHSHSLTHASTQTHSLSQALFFAHKNFTDKRMH